MLKRTSLLVAAIALLGCFAAASAQDKRGPSTAEERQRAIAMATFLEEKPLAKEAKEYRAALFFFLAGVPDITVKLCTNVLGESKRLKGDHESEMIGQLMYSQAKFVIENPDKAQDNAAVYLAGVEGVLRTWQAIKAAKPKAKFALMEELLQKQQAGALADYVKEAMKGCKS